MKKLFLIAALLLVFVFCQTPNYSVSMTGTWGITRLDVHCFISCCCPLGQIVIIADPSNSSQIIYTPTAWSGTYVCEMLERINATSAGSSATSAIWPLPAIVDHDTTPVMYIWNSQGEDFYFDLYPYKSTYLGNVMIDQMEIGGDLSVCDLDMTKLSNTMDS